LSDYFSEKTLAEMSERLSTIQSKTNRLLLNYVGHNFSNAKAKEYAHHGFARRIQTLARCIENVFRFVADAAINIQAAIGNAYGCVDNLAWVWVSESGLSLDRRDVGLRRHHQKVRETLSYEFCTYLSTLDSWFEYLVEYRDAFAHRIPLYVPPGGALRPNHERAQELENLKAAALSAFRPHEYERLHQEQMKLFIFRPLICHSFNEMVAPYAFHPQLIADFLTVEQLGEKMLAELDRARP
jgi:hypothetical protein